MTTEAQKKASAAYHKKKIASIACRVKKEDAELFKEFCTKLGKTPNAVLKEYVMRCIQKE